MPDIKTRETDRTLKIRDGAARLPKELVRDITVKSGDVVKGSLFSAPSAGQGKSMSEEAGDRLQSGMERTVDTGARAAWGAGKKTARRTARKYQERSAYTGYSEGTQNDTGSFPDRQSAEPPTGYPSGEEPQREPGIQPEESAIREKQTEHLRNRAKEGARAVQETVESAGKRTVGDSGKLSYSSAGRIKSKSRMEKMSKSSDAVLGQSRRTYQAGKQLAIKGENAAGKTAKGTKRAIHRLKTAAKTAVTAVRSALALISAGSAAVFLVIILGVIGGIAAFSDNSSAEPLSQEVLAYTATIQKYASQYGIPEYVASYPNSPGAIQDPEYSIQVGVQYYADCVNQAGCESPADMGKLQLSWQGYNYGNGYIGWALTNYGGYSLENALEFSQQQAAAHGWSGYGDPEYVPHVQRYYSGENIFAGLFGNQQIVTVAQNEIGASDGQKYWSWYGFGSYQEWCACFVSWCGEQAGLIESGAMPKFSLCSDGMSWFQNHGKWQTSGSTPSAGTLVFFDWGGDSVPDHVAIVEKCENGIVYTVEGNTSTRVNGESVRGVWQHQYPVSDQSILGYGTI